MAEDDLTLAAGWYVLVYHDVSWEEGPFVRHIGGTCPPDVFRDHLAACMQLGTVVSVQDGLAQWRSGRIEKPIFSFWFDDGFRGVRKYAAPILAANGLTGALSVCSRFTGRTEFFWRFKLSYLHSIDAGRHLRSRLRPFGYKISDLTRAFTIDNFSLELVNVIDQLYVECTNEAVRQDAFRIFDTPGGVAELHRNGWVIANHSAAHYPIGTQHVSEITMEQFEEAEQAIQQWIGQPTDYWVFPFSRNVEDCAITTILRKYPGRRVVLMESKPNFAGSPDGILYRISAPPTDRTGLREALFTAAMIARAPKDERFTRSGWSKS